jgi:hypothetical protein
MSDVGTAPQGPTLGDVAVRHTGFAGHLIVAPDCRFHLTTEVGPYLVSTVGAYAQPGKKAEKWADVGCGRKFETFVFNLGGPCDCGEDCGSRQVSDWSEIDSEGTNTPAAAQAAHEAMVAKYHAAALLRAASPTTTEN